MSDRLELREDDDRVVLLINGWGGFGCLMCLVGFGVFLGILICDLMAVAR